MNQSFGKEVLYTICPVGNASYIAKTKGWLQEGLAFLDVKATRLQTLSKERWDAHFTYGEPALFREGGNIPPIWAKSRGAGPVLIGLTFLEWKQYILVRADSSIESVEQLRNRKLGITTNPYPIDFWKAMMMRGFETALIAKGVSKDEVKFIDLISHSDSKAGWDSKRDLPGERERNALLSGEVDAIYYGGTWAQEFLDTEKVRPIFELSSNPGLIMPIGNEDPNVLTVSRELAEESPEVVVAYLKEVIRAANWAKSNRPEVERIFAEQTFGTPEQVAAARPRDFHLNLAPELTERGLLALESQQRFLFDHGFIKQTFEIEQWAEPRYLKRALEELQVEEVIAG